MSKEVGSMVTTPWRCSIIELGTKEQPDKTTGSGSLAKTEDALSELWNGKGGMQNIFSHSKNALQTPFRKEVPQWEWQRKGAQEKKVQQR